MIEVNELRKEFDTPNGIEVAVDGVSYSVDDGEFFTLVGPSGCGKTTTLRCIAGLEQPTSGSIQISGQEMTYVPPNKRNIAMMFQNIALYPHMTIEANIAYPLKVRGVSKEERAEKALEVAEIVQIPELMDKHPGDLSGGQRQRAALARTIIQDPRAFLMDEPLSDLDAKLKVEIRKVIQRVHRELDKPTIYVTHDQEEAMTMSDRVAVMNAGGIEQIGSPEEIYDRPTNTFVAEFIGSPQMNFLDGSVESLDGTSWTVTVGDVTLEFDSEPFDGFQGDSNVTLGFRPEDVVLSGNGESSYFDVDVQLLEPLGSVTLASLDGPQGEIRATLSDSAHVAEGQRMNLTVDEGNIHVFDGASGDLVTKSVSS